MCLCSDLLYIISVDITAFLCTEGDDTLGFSGSLHHILKPVGITAYQRRMGLGEEPQLGCKIILHGGMLDGTDMILGDIHEDPNVKCDLIHPVILQGLGGDLHGKEVDMTVYRIPEMPHQLYGFRCGDVGFLQGHAVIGIDGGDDRTFRFLPGSQIIVQDRLQIVSGGGLALGSGDARQVKLGRGRTEIQICQERHGSPDVRHQDGRDRHIVIEGLADIADSTAGLRIRQIFLTESGSLADEQRSGGDILGVEGESGDDGILDLGELSLDQKVCFPKTPCIGFQCVFFHGSLLTVIAFKIPVLIEVILPHPEQTVETVVALQEYGVHIFSVL